MDNLTHSVIGLVTGDAIHNATNPRTMPSQERRRLFLAAAVIANNFPDIDVFFKPLLAPPIGSLLWHRGFTHTLIFAPLQAAIIMLLLFAMKSVFSARLKFLDWAYAYLAAVVGICLHILADSWNTYGVHPFYPFNNNWYYGDLIFIIEPLLWSIGGAWILLELKTVWRAFFFTLFSIVVGYGFYLQVINISHIVILLTILLSFVIVMSAQSVGRRSYLAIAGTTLLLSFISVQNSKARRTILETYEMASLPKPVDVALNPSPVNFFCWTALAATVEEGHFVIRKGNVTTWLNLFAPQECRVFDIESKPVTRISSTNQVSWFNEYSTPLLDFRKNSGDCYLRDWLRFARFPQIVGEHAIDVRFSNRRTNNFTLLELKPERSCLTYVPPWNPPRDFLAKEASGG